MTDVLDRARADLAAGRAWKARDRLTGALADRQDGELLDLLAEVYVGMGDLPAAGALWFVTGREDETSSAAVAAWRERFSSDEARWYSIPAPIRRECFEWELHELHGAAMAVAEARRRRPATGGWAPASSRLEDLACGALAFLVAAVVATLMGLGLWTVIAWF